MQRYDAADELLTAYLKASDRYDDAVDELNQLTGTGHPAFLAAHERARRLAGEVEEALSAMTKRQVEDLKRTG